VTVVDTPGWAMCGATIASGFVSLRTRIAAWLLTGPAGHLVAGATDWVTLLARYGWARARGRTPFS